MAGCEVAPGALLAPHALGLAPLETVGPRAGSLLKTQHHSPPPPCVPPPGPPPAPPPPPSRTSAGSKFIREALIEQNKNPLFSKAPLKALPEGADVASTGAPEGPHAADVPRVRYSLDDLMALSESSLVAAFVPLPVCGCGAGPSPVGPRRPRGLSSGNALFFVPSRTGPRGYRGRDLVNRRRLTGNRRRLVGNRRQLIARRRRLGGNRRRLAGNRRQLIPH